MEGDLERIDHKKKSTKVYFAHLFNDALVISTNWKGVGYKFHRAVNLSSSNANGDPATIVKEVLSVVYSNMFEVVTPSITYTFRCGDKYTMDKWINAITDQIQNQFSIQRERNKKAMTKSSSDYALPTSSETMELGSKCNSLQGVDVNALDSHAVRIIKFLDAEYVESEILKSFKNVVIYPVAAASRGAALVVGALTEEENKEISRCSMIQEKGTYISAITKATTKSQIQAVTSALVGDADALLCIRTVELIALSMVDFLSMFEKAMSDANWSVKEIPLTHIFTSQATKIFLNSFITYSSGMLATIRLLCNSKIFASFRTEAEEKIYPHRIESVLRTTLMFPYRCQNFLCEMKKVTTTAMPTTNKIDEALFFVDDIIKQIEKEIALKKNYEKLLEIKSCFTSDLLPDPVLKGLVTTSRTFIAEDELHKVCRKKNKPFRFWLFNDYLIYGSATVAGYKWHHALDISKCSVQIIEDNLKTDSYSFSYNSPEKSFVLVAPSSSMMHKWVDHIREASAARKAELGISEEVTAAPVWIQDSSDSQCCVCKAEFKGFFNRKHHCRECGEVVCGDHSTKRKFLPNIHPTKKQRVCDDCFAGKNELKRNATCSKENTQHKPPSISSKPPSGRDEVLVPPVSSKGSPPVPSAPSPKTCVTKPPPIPSFPPPTSTKSLETLPSPSLPTSSDKVARKNSSQPQPPLSKDVPLLPSQSTPNHKNPQAPQLAKIIPPPPPPPPAQSKPPTRTTGKPPPPPPPPPKSNAMKTEGTLSSGPSTTLQSDVSGMPSHKAATLSLGTTSSERKASGLTLSLLQSIQTGGNNLKAVSKEEKEVKKEQSAGGGLLGMLASAMSERRTVIIDESEGDEDDNDSGWSSDDSN